MPRTICTVEDCTNQVRARRLCGKHYERWRVYGTPHVSKQRRVCTVDDCDRKHWARGLCAMHYDRARRSGTIDLGHPPCACGGVATYKNLCARCYMREVHRRRIRAICSADGCPNQARYANGMCRRHRHTEAPAAPARPRTIEHSGPCPAGCGREWHDRPADRFPMFNLSACQGSTTAVTA